MLAGCELRVVGAAGRLESDSYLQRPAPLVAKKFFPSAVREVRLSMRRAVWAAGRTESGSYLCWPALHHSLGAFCLAVQLLSVQGVYILSLQAFRAAGRLEPGSYLQQPARPCAASVVAKADLVVQYLYYFLSQEAVQTAELPKS